MSKTLKMTISLPLTVVVKTESIAALEASREEIRQMPAEKVAALKGAQKFRYELFAGDKTTEQVLEVIYRQGLREGVRDLIMGEIQGNESTCRVGDIKVTFEAPMVPRSCDRCTQEACFHPNRVANIGCELKRTGLREACGGPRWTETV
jgi:hypothetical protein